MNRRFATVIGMISAFFLVCSVLGLPYFINVFLKDVGILEFWTICSSLFVIVFIYEIFKSIFLPLSDNWPEPEKEF